MAKLPSFQFYPGDWLRDSISGCSLAAQGLWLRMMILMHDSERYGYLQMNGEAMPPETIARRCGCSPAEYTTLLCELERAGIPSKSIEGIIFSRRMVRDDKERAKNREYVKKSRDKRGRKGDGKDECKADVRQMSDDSSYSSSISSSERENTLSASLSPDLENEKPERKNFAEYDAVCDLWLELTGHKTICEADLTEIEKYIDAYGFKWVSLAFKASMAPAARTRLWDYEKINKPKPKPPEIPAGQKVKQLQEQTKGIVPIGLRLQSGEVKKPAFLGKQAR